MIKCVEGDVSGITNHFNTFHLRIPEQLDNRSLNAYYSFMENHNDVDVSDLLNEPKKRPKNVDFSPQVARSEQVKVEKAVPEWFSKFVATNMKDEDSAKAAVSKITRMDLDSLKSFLGGDLRDVPYKTLLVALPYSEIPQVDLELSNIRKAYLREHPEENTTKAPSYYITYDGRVILDEGQELTPAQKREITVGTTCFHYNSGTPGMSDTD